MSAPWLMWGAVSAEVLVLHVLDLKVFIALVGGAIAASWSASVERHAARMEKSTSTHADVLGDKVLTGGQLFDIGVRSNRIAMIDAADARSPHDSGPYRIQKIGRN